MKFNPYCQLSRHFWTCATASDITTSKTMDLRTYLHLSAMHGQIHIVSEMKMMSRKLTMLIEVIIKDLIYKNSDIS